MKQKIVLRPLPAFLLFVLFLTSCLPTSQPSDSGIEGSVSIGPMCPVMQANVPCPDQPYQAKLTVLTTTEKKVARFQTDTQGHFRINLASGDYVLHPESPNGLPYAEDIPFTVKEHQFTHLEISYDSGIR